jgi:sugar/nucleoside kinase (ribokinase family)
LLRIAVASHIALDTIDNEEGYLGGAACYCGLTCRQLGFDTILVTKVGEDFPTDMRFYLKEKGLEIKYFVPPQTTWLCERNVFASKVCPTNFKRCETYRCRWLDSKPYY